MSRGWNGSTVRRWRTYWRANIIAAEDRGEPLVCPFIDTDPQCPGFIRAVDEWDVDHRQQRIDGGPLGLANQAPAHTSCNRRAGQVTAVARRTERHTRVRRWT